jgi:hypothetical protein
MNNEVSELLTKTSCFTIKDFCYVCVCFNLVYLMYTIQLINL